MTDQPLPTILRAEILGEIMAYQTKLYQNATGELPSSDALDVVAAAAASWLEKLLPLLRPPAYYPAQEFEEVPDEKFRKMLFNTWYKKWYEIYVLRAQVFGLSVESAQKLVDHLHGRTA